MSSHEGAVGAEDLLSRRFDALADSTRRQVLEMLRVREAMTAGAIAAEFPEISRPAVSRHLRVLREAGLVEAESSGREVLYSLESGALDDLWRSWFAAFAAISDGALGRLRRRVVSEADHRGDHQTKAEAKRKADEPPRRDIT